MTERKLKTAAPMLLSALLGVILGAGSTTWLYSRIYGSNGDLAATRTIEAAQLLIDNQGQPYSSDQVYRNALQAMHRKTVEAGMSFGSIRNPEYAAILKRICTILDLHPELDSDATQDSSRVVASAYSAQTASAVRACIVQEDTKTASQVSDCAIKVIQRSTQSPAPASTATAAIPLVGVN